MPEFIDLLPNPVTKNVLDHGSVTLCDMMPRIVPAGRTADMAIAQAARKSYGREATRSVADDVGLIRWLMRQGHTSPFEQVELKFHLVMPIFVQRQWIRYRTANVNELSGRYAEMPFRYYRPATVGMQSIANKQGSESEVSPDLLAQFDAYLERSIGQHEAYESLIAQGVAKESARIGLPLNLYTEMVWKIDLHNLFNLFSQRMDPHAQWEIQQFARAMHDIVQPLAPAAFEAWRNYKHEAMTLSRDEVLAIAARRALGSGNKREDAEHLDKLSKLGL